jgi:hypothetical protein
MEGLSLDQSSSDIVLMQGRDGGTRPKFTLYSVVSNQIE